LSDGITKGVNALSSSIVLSRAFVDTISFITKDGSPKVSILASVPVLKKPLSTYIFNVYGFKDKSLLTSEYLKQREFMDSTFETLSDNANFFVLDPAQLFCPGNECQTSKNGEPLYVDDNHVTKEGAMMLNGLIEDYFDTYKNNDK
jgi:hypothetical protein